MEDRGGKEKEASASFVPEEIFKDAPMPFSVRWCDVMPAADCTTTSVTTIGHVELDG